MLSLQPECWAITDQSAGNQRQALALAECLGLPVRHLILEPRWPWSWLAPRIMLGGRLALPSAQRAFYAPPWPDLAIGCGRAAALFTRMLRPLSEGRCFTVQILDPRIDPAHWDMVVAPRHDQLSAPNVLNPLGSLNPVDERWLADGRASCPQFSELPAPRVGVLIGGPRQGMPLDVAGARQLLDRLLVEHEREGGSLLVLASRRTPAAVIDVFRHGLHGIPGLVWAGRDDGRNPYPGVLGWADRLIVTPDSVNMISEACATGCPVQTLVTAPLPGKIARFHQTLREAGLLHALGEPCAATRAAPLRETMAIAHEIKQRIRERQQVEARS